jgi:hypothetical protein
LIKVQAGGSRAVSLVFVQPEAGVTDLLKKKTLETEEEPADARAWKGVVIAAIVVIGLWLGWWWMPNETHQGQSGDMFGSLNTLYSGLAFAVLIGTLVLQRAELRLQRRELADTRGVMEEQQKQLSKQAAAADKQVFESTFFELLRLLREVILEENGPQRDTFLVMLLDFQSALVRDERIVAIDGHLDKHGEALRPITRVLEQLYDLASDRDPKSKKLYLALIAAQLPTQLVGALAIYANARRLSRVLVQHLHENGVLFAALKAKLPPNIRAWIEKWIDDEHERTTSASQGAAQSSER